MTHPTHYPISYKDYAMQKEVLVSTLVRMTGKDYQFHVEDLDSYYRYWLISIEVEDEYEDKKYSVLVVSVASDMSSEYEEAEQSYEYLTRYGDSYENAITKYNELVASAIKGDI